MKFLIPLLSFFLGNAKHFFKEPSQAITQQLALHARALTLLVITSVGALVIFCVGLSLFFVNLANQLDQSSTYQFTAGSAIYLLLTLISGFILFWVLRKNAWSQALNTPSKTQERKGSPIENAVALLMMDFLEERQQKRSSKMNSDSQS